MARRRPADDMACPEGVSNVGALRPRLAAGQSGPASRGVADGRSRSRRTYTPREYEGIALRRRRRRCYPLRALGAGTFAGDLTQASDVAWQRVIRPRMGVERSFADLASPTPTVAGATYRTVTHIQVRSNEWTRSKSGEPPSVSSRSPCRRRTMRR